MIFARPVARYARQADRPLTPAWGSEKQAASCRGQVVAEIGVSLSSAFHRRLQMTAVCSATTSVARLPDTTTRPATASSRARDRQRCSPAGFSTATSSPEWPRGAVASKCPLGRRAHGTKCGARTRDVRRDGGWTHRRVVAAARSWASK